MATILQENQQLEPTSGAPPDRLDESEQDLDKLRMGKRCFYKI